MPDLVRRDFTADRPGVKFVGDITYIHTWQGFVYLHCHLIGRVRDRQLRRHRPVEQNVASTPDPMVQMPT